MIMDYMLNTYFTNRRKLLKKVLNQSKLLKKVCNQSKLLKKVCNQNLGEAQAKRRY
jgi:hypothetical protein